MRKLLYILFCLIFIIFLRLFLSYFLNEFIIYNYNKGIYNDYLIKFLYVLNFNQSYVVYYNNGNIMYKKEKYDDALYYYQKAISKNPPNDKICDIRVNMSLTIIKNIKSNDLDYIYSQLEDARSNLYLNNCVSKDSDKVTSKSAKKLDNEIIKVMESIKNSSSNYSYIKNELKNIESNAYSYREKEMSGYENIDNYSYYSGKNW